jgi:hypothetical protein
MMIRKPSKARAKKNLSLMERLEEPIEQPLEEPVVREQLVKVDSIDGKTLEHRRRNRKYAKGDKG